MLGNRKLILDTFCEVYDLLLPWMDGDFFDFGKHEVVPGAVYLIGRAQMNHNKELIRKLIESEYYELPVLSFQELTQQINIQPLGRVGM